MWNVDRREDALPLFHDKYLNTLFVFVRECIIIFIGRTKAPYKTSKS